MYKFYSITTGHAGTVLKSIIRCLSKSGR